MYVSFTVVLTKAPAAQTTNYYSNVTFNCRGIGDLLEWTVNGEGVNKSTLMAYNIKINKTVDGFNLSSTLMIEAVPTTDGFITIGCIIVSLVPFNLSARAVNLTTRG